MKGGLSAVSLPGIRRPLSEPEASSIDNYLNLLSKWQKTHRLVGSTDRSWMIEHLILDSLLFLDLVPERAAALIDIGSGAGVPGMTIAVVRPTLKVTMVESMRRRVSFLLAAIRELDLRNAEVLGTRVESIESSYHRRFDVAVMRCAGRPEALVVVARALVAPGGQIIAAGGPDGRPVAGSEVVTVQGARGPRRFHRWRVD